MGGPHRYTDCGYGTAPTAAYNEVFKPYDWGYFTLGASRGLAFHWWFPLAASLIALYALFLLLGHPSSVRSRPPS